MQGATEATFGLNSICTEVEECKVATEVLTYHYADSDSMAGVKNPGLKLSTRPNVKFGLLIPSDSTVDEAILTDSNGKLSDLVAVP